MDKIVFWDVDTQIDFIEPTGKLHVPGAQALKSNLSSLTVLGAERARLCGSVDAHLPDDPEFVDWPEHCVYGTPGQRKVVETLIEGTLYVPYVVLTEGQLNEVVQYTGQVLFEKRDNDVRTNDNAKKFLELINPNLVVVYGVVSEICVNLAVEFIAGDLGYDTIVISDAIKELDINVSESCQAAWRKLGTKMMSTNEVEKMIK